MKVHEFKTKVVRWEGTGAAWHFLPVDKEASDTIKKSQEGKPRIGWGSIRVQAAIGNTTWNSSIFPDKKSGCYLLPLKAEIRKKEGITAGDIVTVIIAL